MDLCQSEAVINHGSNRNNPSYTFDDHLNDHSHEQQSESEELGHDQDSEHFKDSKSSRFILRIPEIRGSDKYYFSSRYCFQNDLIYK